MPTLANAEAVRTELEAKLKGKAYFSGIEIAAYQKDGVYTAEPCVRILTNKKGLTLKQLKLPNELNGVKLQAIYSVIEPL
jgi:hypothetical protein